MIVEIFFLSSLLASCRGAVDLTLVPNARGPSVIEAAVTIIQEKGLFKDDALMLRRWAKASSDDGHDAGAFPTGFYGSIWKVKAYQYQKL